MKNAFFREDFLSFEEWAGALDRRAATVRRYLHGLELASIGNVLTLEGGRPNGRHAIRDDKPATPDTPDLLARRTYVGPQRFLGNQTHTYWALNEQAKPGADSWQWLLIEVRYEEMTWQRAMSVSSRAVRAIDVLQTLKLPYRTIWDALRTPIEQWRRRLEKDLQAAAYGDDELLGQNRDLDAYLATSGMLPPFETVPPEGHLRTCPS